MGITQRGRPGAGQSVEIAIVLPIGRAIGNTQRGRPGAGQSVEIAIVPIGRANRNTQRPEKAPDRNFKAPQARFFKE